MDERYKAFVNDNVEFYEKKWRKEYSWNWAAFFLSFLWMGYRKMYKQIFILFGVFLLLDLLWFRFTVNPENTSSVISFIIFIVIGFTGNKLYKNKTKNAVNYISDLKLSKEEELEELSTIGGISFSGVLVSVSIAFGYFLLSSALL
jgi:hypothetical protein